ncbi:MAG: hypothetical protein HY909_30800 [Deltaproteobacteria bacterium]|nr:hypothetical protein [Deltaproteobacteria bacterium]
MRTLYIHVGAVLLFARGAAAQTVERGEAPAMVSWINAARAQQGLAAMAADPRLDALAEGHSTDMARQGFFDHVSPTTGSPDDRVRASGLQVRGWAENIALNQSARGAFDALLQSPGHRANILDPNLRSVGVGLVRGPRGLYVTQVFALFPNGASPAVAVPATPTAPSPATQAPAPTPAAPTTALPSLPQLPQLPQLPGVGALPQLPGLSGLPGVQVLPRPTAPGASPDAWDVVTPFGTFRVTRNGAPGASTGLPGISVLDPSEPPSGCATGDRADAAGVTPTAPATPSRPQRRPRHPGRSAPGRVTQVELPAIGAPAQPARPQPPRRQQVALENDRLQGWTGAF